MPPSVNKIYLPVRGRFIPSKHLISYKKELEHYYLTFRLQIEEIAQSCMRAYQSGQVISFTREFYFQRTYLFTKKGTPRKFDLTNREKALDDGISNFIGVDDSAVFSSTSRKRLSPLPLREFVNVTIQAYSFNESDVI